MLGWTQQNRQRTVTKADDRQVGSLGASAGEDHVGRGEVQGLGDAFAGGFQCAPRSPSSRMAAGGIAWVGLLNSQELGHHLGSGWHAGIRIAEAFVDLRSGQDWITRS
jgi:hypothetical protein